MNKTLGLQRIQQDMDKSRSMSANIDACWRLKRVAEQKQGMKNHGIRKKSFSGFEDSQVHKPIHVAVPTAYRYGNQKSKPFLSKLQYTAERLKEKYVGVCRWKKVANHMFSPG